MLGSCNEASASLAVELQGSPVARFFQKVLLKVLEEINLFLSFVMMDKSDLGKLVCLLQQLGAFLCGGVFWWVFFFLVNKCVVNSYICSLLNIKFGFVKMLIHITGHAEIMCFFKKNFKASALWVFFMVLLAY